MNDRMKVLQIIYQHQISVEGKYFLFHLTSKK